VANANLVQTNFTAGEISPKLFGRYDVERYKNAVAEMYGFVPQIQGGAKSTPMRRYNATAKHADKPCRLIKFEFSKSESNMLEFGHNYIRFFNQDRTQVMDGLNPYEIATVYDETELFDIEYVGGADTIFLFHENHPVQRLRRFENDNWSIENTPFSPEPFFEQGLNPAETLTLSAATVGAGRTFTAGGASFLSADVGRRITYLNGVALITGYTSPTVVTCTIETAFDSTSIAASVWTITGAPQAVCTPSTNGSIGETIQLQLSTGTIYGTRLTLDAAVFDGVAVPPEIDFSTVANHGYSAANTVQIEGCTPVEYNGFYELVSASTDIFSVNYAPDPGAISAYGTVRSVATGTAANGWRAGDVGAFIQINGGLMEITAYNSTSSVDAIVRQVMSSDAAAQAGAWTLNQSIWNAANGYPRCGTFFQQSLVVGGSPAYPHSVAKSRTSEYLNFELGVLDDDAFLYTLDVDEYDPILHMSKVKSQLLVLTSGSEFTLTGGVESPMTPTNVQVANPSDYGCNTVRPVRVDNELVFSNRTGRKIRGLGYQITRDSFSSPDLVKLSEHITGDGVVDMTYQQEPESILWAVREDGVMVTSCIDREEGILAWCRQVPTAGTTYESVESMPNADGVDEVWCVVNTGTTRYIESFDPASVYGLASAISATTGTPTDTWSGLNHLEGETVEVVADAIIVPSVVVSSGQVVIARVASEVSIGLPSRGYIKTLSPEFFTQSGSAQGNNVRIAKISIQVLNTFALNINDQYIDYRSFGDSLLDLPPPVYTGIFDVLNQGWQERGYISIEQPNALPVHVLSIILQLTVNPR